MGPEYCRTGPVVQLGAASSLFPRQLDTIWRAAGKESFIVSREPPLTDELASRTRVVEVADFKRGGVVRWLRGSLYWSLHLVQQAMLLPFRGRVRRFARDAGEGAIQPYFLNHVFDAFPAAAAVRSLRPSLVFGHEASTYGPATALCSTAPRILKPWGADIFVTAQTSPWQWLLVRWALRSVELVLPGSVTAARYIVDHFGVPQQRVHPFNLGVDLTQFRRPEEAAEIARIRRRWSLPEDAVVILNVRRFRPLWGSRVILEAFLRLARLDPDLHFVLVGGRAGQQEVARARQEAAACGLAHRFTFFDSEVTLETFAQLMSVADVFTSVMGTADMRSASVLQGSAAGGIPVLSDVAEHREMTAGGYWAKLVDHADLQSVVAGLRSCLEIRGEWPKIREMNRDYVRAHADRERQSQELVDLVDELCGQFAERHGVRP